MSGIITRKFRIFSAEQFKEQFGEAETSNVYLFIGRPSPWNDDNNPPTPVDKVADTDYSVWNSMIAMKKISSSDVTFAVPRNNWTTGTVYSQYTATSEFHQDNDFFVITDEYQVYKCMFNNGGATSTVKPTGRLTTIFETADGYKWKFMYEIAASDALKYATTSFIPVKYLSTDDGSFQWDVQAAAVNGAIETIGVSSGGSNYKTNSGNVVTANTTTVTLAASANSTNDIYNGSTVYISGGTGEGQLRRIVDYVGSTKLATVNTAFSTTPDTTSSYIVSPRISVSSGDGSGLLAYSTVSSGTLSKVEVINAGSNYSYATLAVSANTGSGATVAAHLAPSGGHGSNPVQELYGHNVMCNVKLTGDESGVFFTSNDFRVVGLVSDPVLANGSLASASTYQVAPSITITGGTGTFTTDETITGGTSGATATFVEYSNSSVLLVTNVVGTFQTSESITGASASATVSSFTTSALKFYSGQILYVENRSPIIRSEDQEEDFKIIVRM